MTNVEKLIRKGVDAAFQKLGLRPRHFSSREEAITTHAKDFLNVNGARLQILNLPPPEKKDPALTEEEKV